MGYLVAGYIASAALSYGLTLGYFQGRFPLIRSNSDVVTALFAGILGPCGLFATIVTAWLHDGRPFRYGLQFLPKPSISYEEYLQWKDQDDG